MNVMKISLALALSLTINAVSALKIQNVYADEPTAVSAQTPSVEHVYLTSNLNAVVGAELTVNADYLNGANEGNCTYKWYSSNDQEVKSTDSAKSSLLAEGKNRSYTVTQNEVGKYIFCVVIPDGGKTNISLSYGKIVANTGVDAPAVDATSMRIWANDMSIGSTLYAHYTYQNTNGIPEMNSSVTWKRSDSFGSGYTDIPGETGMSYTIKPEDYGKYITYTVTPDGGSTADMSSRIYCMPENQLAYAFADCANKRNPLYNDSIIGVTDFIVDNRGCQTWGGNNDILYSFDAGKKILFDKLVFLGVEMDALNKIEISDDGVNYTDLKIESYPFTKEKVTEYKLEKPVSTRYIRAYFHIFSNATLSEFQVYLSPQSFSEILGVKDADIKYARTKKTITNIPVSMTVAELKASLYVSSETPTLEVINYEGETVSDDEKIFSGYTLKSTASNGNTNTEYVLSNTSEVPEIVVSSISITPDKIRVGSNAVGNYQLKKLNASQDDVDVELQWYYSDTADGEYLPIDGEQSAQYTIENDKVGGYLKLLVSPKGGETRMSDAAGPIRPQISDIPTAPECESIKIEKTAETVYVGDELKGTYVYFDANDDDEDKQKTEKQWFRKDKNCSYKKIDGAVGDSYTLTEADVDFEIVFGVKPCAKVEPQPENYTYSKGVNVTKEPAMSDYEDLSIGTNLKNVKSNLVLTLKGKNNSDISWSSSNSSVVGTDGVVRRQGVNQNVTLTATIKHPERELTLTKKFDVTVLARESGGSSGSGGGSGSGKNNVGTIFSEPIKTPTPTEQPNPSYNLKDLSQKDWSYKYVVDLIDKNVLSNPDDGKFRPDDFLKREEAIKMLVEMFGIKSSFAQNDFDDVLKEHWAYDYIAVAREKGITDGIGNNKFGIGADITRQDFTVMTYNSLKKIKDLENEMNDELKFADEADVADYATEAVGYLAKKGIINGTDENMFLPDNNITRKEAAKIMSCLSETL